MKFSVNFSLTKFNLKYWVGISVNLLVMLVEILLAARVFFRFFFTGQHGSFFQWLYGSTDTALAPFRGIYGNATPTPPTHWYVDFVALFAMAAYPIVAYAAVSIVGWLATGRRR